MAKTKAAGTALKGQKVAIDIDGMTPAEYAKRSAALAGMSQSDWFNQFNQGMQASGTSSVAGQNVTDASSFSQAINSAQSQGQLGSMLKSVNNANSGPFLADPDWQPTTSATWKTQQTDWKPVSEKDRKKAVKNGDDISSWVDTETGTFKPVTKTVAHPLDPDKVPFIARQGYPNGGIFALTNPNDPDSPTVYAIRGDYPPNNNFVEVSPAAATPFGIDPNPIATPTGTPNLQADYLGPSNLLQNGQQPTFDQIQAEGKRLQDLKNAKKKDKKASADDPQNGSGGKFKVAKGEDSVRLGVKGFPAAYADASCIHTGGGYVADGSDSCRVGKGQWKFARVTDPTSDNYNLTTGEKSVGIA
jgi:hypothetical protein